MEDFQTVASEVSVSEGYADASGYVGWVPKGAFPELDPLLYGDAELGIVALSPGEKSALKYAQDGIYIIEILSGPEERGVSDKMGIKLTLELTQAWQDEALQEGSSNGKVKMHLNSRLYEWVADQVFVTAPRVPVTGQPAR